MTVLSHLFVYVDICDVICVSQLGGNTHVPTYAQLDIRTDNPELRAEVKMELFFFSVGATFFLFFSVALGLSLVPMMAFAS